MEEPSGKEREDRKLISVVLAEFKYEHYKFNKCHKISQRKTLRKLLWLELDDSCNLIVVDVYTPFYSDRTHYSKLSHCIIRYRSAPIKITAREASLKDLYQINFVRHAKSSACKGNVSDTASPVRESTVHSLSFFQRPMSYLTAPVLSVA